MRKWAAIILLAAMSAIFCTAAAAQTNLIGNGGFESGNENWKTVSAELNIKDGAADGAFCGEVVMTKSYGRAMNKAQFKRGVKYIISVYVRLKEGRNTASLIVDHRSFGDKTLIKAVAKDVRVSREWAKLTGIYEWNGEGTGEAYIYVRIGDALEPVTFYMDNLSVEVYGDEPKEFKETVLNVGELMTNPGFDKSTEPFTANNAALLLFEGDGAEDTASCALVSIGGRGSNIGQQIRLLPKSKYRLSAYVKSTNAAIDFDFGVSLQNNEIIGNKYITDYSAENISASAPYMKKMYAGETAGEQWRLISAEYEYRGENECDAYVCLCPSADSKTEYLVDGFSVVKTGEVSINTETDRQTKGFYVNNALINLKGGYEFYGGTVMVRMDELSEIIGADFSFNPPVCTVTKGFNTVSINTDTGISRLNDRLIAAQKPYFKDGEVMADAISVCTALGGTAEADSANDSVKITFNPDKNGLSKTAESLIVNKSASIAFVGGAAAYGSGAGVREESAYRPLIMSHMRNRYTDCTFKEINHSIGAVNSGMEVYRIKELMEETPDLVLVDFLPEDCGREPLEVINNLRSIVCGIRSIKPDTDIVFVQSYCSALEEYYKGQKSSDIVQAYNTVAQQYGIPVIDTGLKLYDKSADKISDYILYDYYPNDSGHKLYADLICEFIDESLALPAGVRTRSAENTSGTVTGEIIGTETAEINGFERNGKVLTGNAGDELTFDFCGTEIGLLWNIGIDTGSVGYEIDGKSYEPVIAFDNLGVRSRHMNYVMLAQGLKNTKHTLKLKALDKKDNMSLGTRLEINGFLAGTETE